MSETPQTTMHVYEMNDYEWWMAASAEEARRDYVAMTGIDEFEEDRPRQLTDVELDRLKFKCERRNAAGQMEEFKHTFREELAAREQKSQYFATSEI